MNGKLLAFGIIAAGILLCAGGIYVGETDDAPGAALLGFLLLAGAVALGVKRARRQA